ncbi:hypothetical protein [Bacillus badius]|uniref:hypothetical protein n=1 Tax=Bacillus badius TaxID=1455 RepID=UPI0005978580|nr:hypothetical protein [Bacillus badius]KIL73152.1 hypothetical protein SD78_3340 [Bacillus badius]
MNNKRMIWIVSLLILLLGWSGYSYTRPAILVAESSTGSWEASCTPVSFPNPKSLWEGKVQWKGHKKIEVNLVEFKENQTVRTSIDFPSTVHPGETLEFASLGMEPSNKTHTLFIQWNDGENSQEDLLSFEKKKRWFVFPF